MKRYKDKKTGIRVVEVSDLSFLRERDHKYGWFKRHYLHVRFRRSLKTVGKIIAVDSSVAKDIAKYYRVPSDMIHIK